MLFLTLRLFNELARRPGRVLIVCCLLCELRATEEQLAARVTDGTISVMKLTVAFLMAQNSTVDGPDIATNYVKL